jgi:TPR repeat protein
MSDNSYLRDLVLLRNDPSKIPPIRYAALQGEVDAQYAMGLIHAEGRGTEVDLARAHYWLSMAIAQGDKEADTLRNIVGSQMNDDDFSQAMRLRNGPELQLVQG